MKKKYVITLIIIIMIIIIGIIVLKQENNTYATSTKLKDIVISKCQGITWERGSSGVYNTIYTKEDGTTIGSDYRYIGANPNNYVKFNNDMYQIIGVFDENTHGKTHQQLVKLIRARTFGKFAFGTYNTSATSASYGGYSNDWTGKEYATPVSANILLNEYFLNKIEYSNTYGNCQNWTYWGPADAYRTKNCQNIVGYGINKNYRSYIETVTWHLNGPKEDGLPRNDLYLCERGLYTDCTSSNNGGGDSQTNAKIGLMYASDYAYGCGNEKSDSTYPTNQINFGITNWIQKGNEWTITPVSGSNYSNFYVYEISSVKSWASSYNASLRPTFYLKEDVYVTMGTGTFDNPYILDCDTCN